MPGLVGQIDRLSECGFDSGMVFRVVLGRRGVVIRLQRSNIHYFHVNIRIRGFC